ncbi:DUF805 domain-containing protein [Paeniglutamicibacter sp. NPDC091659]|uniref:DUF805 domain-containing protein n=1 Tax=Paeniglutamicibacter sp. NPDC091659 TaxID=3364389 RepID=UPI0037F65C64
MSYPANPYGNHDASTAQDSLDLPRYGASFGEAVKRYFKKYATFSGRASRSEYWWVALFNALIGLVAVAIMAMGGAFNVPVNSTEMPPGAVPGVLLLTLYGLATFIPSLALVVRRFHDGNFSGWLYLLALVPFFGSLVVLIFVLMPSNPAGARFDKGHAWPAGQPTS